MFDDFESVFTSALGASLLQPSQTCRRCRGNGCDRCAQSGRKAHKIARRMWTPEEDARVIELAQNMDKIHFPTIATHIPGRSVQSVRERYRNYLSREVGVREKELVREKRRFWTKREDKMLLKHYRKHNLQKLKKFLPNRTKRAIRERRLMLIRQSQGRSYGERRIARLR